MISTRTCAIVLTSLWTAALLGTAAEIPTNGPLPTNATTVHNARIESYIRLPLIFEENNGQYGAEVRFVARKHGVVLLFTAQEVVLATNPAYGN